MFFWALVQGITASAKPIFAEANLSRSTSFLETNSRVEFFNFLENIPINSTVIFTEITVCSGEAVSGLIIGANEVGQNISWEAESSIGVNGINTTSGSGIAPLTLPTWTLSNNTISDQFVNVVVTWEDGSSSVEYHIEVKPVINIYLGPPSAPTAICSGENLFSLVNTNVHNVNVAWEVQNSAVAGGSNGSGSYVFDQLVNDGNELESIVYEFFTPDEICPADTLSYQVVVVPEYQLAPLPNLSACPDDELFVENYALPNGGISYQWSVSGDDIGLNDGVGMLESFYAASESDTPATGWVEIEANWMGCTAETTFEVLVHPRPVLEVISTNSDWCSGESLDVVVNSSVSNTEIHWEVSSNPTVIGGSNGASYAPLLIQDVWTNESADVENVEYLFSTPSATCPANPLNWNASIAPDVSLPDFVDVQICSGEVLNLNGYDLGIADAQYGYSIGPAGMDSLILGSGMLVDVPVANASNSNALIWEGWITVDANGCADSSGFSVIIEPIPTIMAESVNEALCSGAELDLTLTSSISGTSIAWESQPGDSILGASSSQGTTLNDLLINEGTSTDSVLYQLTTLGAFCPSDTLDLVVSVLPGFEMPEWTDIIACEGQELEIPSFQLPISGISYSWANSNTSIGLGASGDGDIEPWIVINGTNAAISAVIEVSASLPGCAPSLASFEIDVYPIPQLSANVGPNGGLDCQTGIAILEGFSALGNGTFTWNGPGAVDASGSWVEVSEVGSYIMEFVDAWSGCEALLEVEVVPPVPVVLELMSYDSLVCFGQEVASIVVEGSGGNELLYAWSPPFSMDEVAEGLGAGTYQVVVSNESNCVDTIQVEIEEIPELTISVVDSGIALCDVANGYVEVASEGGYGAVTLDWGIAQGPMLWAVSSDTYALHVEDEFGCALDTAFTIGCLDEIPVGVNQLVTPNGDGKNDEFFLEDLYLYPDHELRVYNRWGELVYEASPYVNDWNGTWEARGGKGQRLPSATYYYLFETGMDDPAAFRGFIEIQNEGR